MRHIHIGALEIHVAEHLVALMRHVVTERVDRAARRLNQPHDHANSRLAGTIAAEQPTATVFAIGLAEVSTVSERWRSERVLTVDLAQDGHSSNLEVEEKRPVVDVEQVATHPVFDLLQGGRLAAPTIDLRPAGDAGLDPMA